MSILWWLCDGRFANLPAVQSGYEEVFLEESSNEQDFLPKDMLDLVPKMIQATPD